MPQLNPVYVCYEWFEAVYCIVNCSDVLEDIPIQVVRGSNRPLHSF